MNHIRKVKIKDRKKNTIADKKLAWFTQEYDKNYIFIADKRCYQAVHTSTLCLPGLSYFKT